MSSIYNDSPRERVRVARKLTRAYTRYYGKTSRTVSSALFGICVLQAFGDTSQGDTLLKLADVIDPTCSIVDKHSKSGPSGITTEYDLSCGHTVSDIDGEPPTYCPICGRRVVEETPDGNEAHATKCPGALEGSSEEEDQKPPLASEESNAAKDGEPGRDNSATAVTTAPQDQNDDKRAQGDSPDAATIHGANPYASTKPASTSQQTPEETNPSKPPHDATDGNQ